MHAPPTQVIANDSGWHGGVSGRVVRPHSTSPFRLPHLPNQPRVLLAFGGVDLPNQICQSADAACRGDEAAVRATTRGGNLPVAK